MSRPKTSSLMPRKTPSLKQGLCLRCKKLSHPGCRSGPDGTRTLCEQCFSLYQRCQLTLFQQPCGIISVVRMPMTRAVGVKGFRRTTPTQHYLNPLVYLLHTGESHDRTEGDGGRKEDLNSHETDHDNEGQVAAAQGIRTGCLDVPTEKNMVKPAESSGLTSIEGQNGCDAEIDNYFAGPRSHGAIPPVVNGNSKEDAVGESNKEPLSDKGGSGSNSHGSTTIASADGKQGKLVSVKVSLVQRYVTKLTRRFSVQSDVGYKGLCLLIKQMFRAKRIRQVTYLDEDDDVVTVSSDNELAEMFSFACSRRISPIRVAVKAE